MEKNYKYWVARDKNGRLFIYDTPIFKDEKIWTFVCLG